MEIVAVGRVEVYAARGSYQLIIQKAFPQGMGEIRLVERFDAHPALGAEIVLDLNIETFAPSGWRKRGARH